MKRWILQFVIVLPLIALFYFGLKHDATRLPSVLLNQPAPDFTLETAEGKTVSLSGLKGSPVVLNFWASWCHPCLQEHVTFGLARENHKKQGVRFFGIVYQDTRENVAQYVGKYGEAFDVLFDSESKTAIDYGVGGVPETFFIDREGVIRHKHAGVMTEEALEVYVEKISARPSSSNGH